MNLQPYQQRVVDESLKLHDQLDKLTQFLETETFSKLPEAEQVRLQSQSVFMTGYAAILRLRIAAF